MKWKTEKPHQLPETIDWERIRHHALEFVASHPYPPERLWLVSPDGQIRAQYEGDDLRVTVPWRELGRLYQAILLHSHPPGFAPTIHDTYQAVIASSPLLLVYEGGRVHLVSVWHGSRPGLVGSLLFTEARSLEHGMELLAAAGCRARWDVVLVGDVESALERLAREWKQFVEEGAYVSLRKMSW